MDKIIKKQIGNKIHTFVVSGKNLFEVQMAAQQLSFHDVPKCGHCGGANLFLKAYITEKDKFEYIKIVCRDCWHTLTFGQVKGDTNTFYLRRKKDSQGNNTKEYDWQPPIEQKAQQMNQQVANQDNMLPDDIPMPEKDDLPF